MAGNVQNILHVLTHFTFTTRPSAGNYCPHHMGREVLSQRLNNQLETTQLLKKPQVQAVSSTAHGLGHPPILLNPHSSAEWLLNEYMLSESMLSECLNESKCNSLQDSRSHWAVLLGSRFSRPLPFLLAPMVFSASRSIPGPWKALSLQDSRVLWLPLERRPHP